MRRSIRLAASAALNGLLALALVDGHAEAQRGRGGDSTAGRGAGLPLTPTHAPQVHDRRGDVAVARLSPDGRTIVFELLGDIYTIPIDGGKATRITSGQAFDAQPHYSPDGKAIVFVSDRSQSDNLWIVNADGSNPRALTRDNDQHYFQSPTFTPDGKYVVVVEGQRRLHVLRAWWHDRRLPAHR